MALVKPIVQSIAAFDATETYRFEFVIDDSGDPIGSSELRIEDQNTGDVFTQTNSTSQRYCDLPANTLTNGHYYTYSFRTKGEGVLAPTSEWSDLMPFYCYTTPVITMLNITNNQVLESSNYEFRCTYSQAEGELLNYIRITVYNYEYDEHGEPYVTNIISSGNILANQTNEYSATFYGMANDLNWGLEVIGYTVEKTRFSLEDQIGGMFRFSVDADIGSSTSQIDVIPNCEEGYIEVTSHIVATDGETKYEPQYEDDSHIVLLPRNNYVQWTKGFTVQSSFAIGLWGRIGQAGEILRFYNNKNNAYVTMEYRRGYCEIDQAVSNTVYDYIKISFYNDREELVCWVYSNPITPLNPDEWYRFFFKFMDYTDVQSVLTKTTSTTFDFAWNEPTTALYGQMMPENWQTSDYKDYGDFGSSSYLVEAEGHSVNELYNLIPVTACKLSNGIYDGITITNDMTVTSNTISTDWDMGKTIMSATFENNISAGNLESLIQDISAMRLKRKRKDASEWLTLKQYNITKPEDMVITYRDGYVPSNVEQEYALAFVDNNGQEILSKNYISKGTGRFNWKYTFMTVGDVNLKMYGNIEYGSIVKNREIGQLQPLQGKYPVLLQNSELSYLSGSFSTMILGKDFLNTNKIDRLSVVKQLEEIHALLDTGRIVCFKDWNGNIIIGRPSSGDSMSFDANYGNGVCRITFNFVEQAKYDNQQELYEVGIIDINL